MYSHQTKLPASFTVTSFPSINKVLISLPYPSKGRKRNIELSARSSHKKHRLHIKVGKDAEEEEVGETLILTLARGSRLRSNTTKFAFPSYEFWNPATT